MPHAQIGTLMQTFKADAYHGKRMRLAAMVRTEAVDAWAGLWMRVDGPNGTVLAFDTMQEQPIQGTTDWQEYTVVLDVPPEAVTVASVIVSGSGQAWITDVRFEEVDETVLVTATKGGMQYKDAPGNLDVREDWNSRIA